jgi:hypothetical protein
MRCFKLGPSAFFKLLAAAAAFALGLAAAGLWPRQSARPSAAPAAVSPAQPRAEVSVRDTYADAPPAPERRFEHSYRNYVYGFSVSIPAGMVGSGSTPPAPDHGFGIDLDNPHSTAWNGAAEFPKSYLYVDGSYNSVEWERLGDVAETHLRYLRENRRNVSVWRRKTTRLGGLSATRIVARYEEGGVEMVSDEVIAFQGDVGEATAVYTLSLSTPLSKYERDRPVLEEMQKGWCLQPIR